MIETGHYKNVKKILWLILFLNVIVAGVKMVMGTIISSASMFADGVHSLSDGSSNIVGLIGIGLASKPVDEDHPYGHNKFETVSGLFIAVMLLVVAITIIKGGIEKLIDPVVPNITIESLIVLGATLVVNIFVATFEYKKGKKLGSLILISDSMHTRSDIFVTIGVFITLVGVRMGLPPIIDPIVSLVVALVIIKAAYDIFIETNGVLTDKAVEDSKNIECVVLSFPDVKVVHKIRSRGTTNCMYIDMHVQVRPNMTVEASHVLIHEIEEKIKSEINENSQTIIHIEPYYPR
jgi:cation diffusion facilitator family transporter